MLSRKAIKVDEAVLGKIEEFAYLALSIPQLSLLTRLDIGALYEADQAVKDAVDRGRLLMEVQIRKNVIEHAISGSATAQEQVFKLIKSYKMQEA
jgi:hypothetical protein